MTIAAPFAATRHTLPAGVLRPFSAAEAAALGIGCAEIDPYHRLGMTAEALSAYLQRPDPALARFAVEVEGQLCGVIAIRHPWLRGPFVEMLAILPAAQGRGLGRQIVAWAASEAAPAARNLWATVSDFNDAARRFYRGLGFTEVAPLPGLVDKNGAEILLRLSI